MAPGPRQELQVDGAGTPPETPVDANHRETWRPVVAMFSFAGKYFSGRLRTIKFGVHNNPSLSAFRAMDAILPWRHVAAILSFDRN